MTRFLHASDIHLSAKDGERCYSLAVFREIVSVARAKNVDLVIIAGDLFNTYRDMELLRHEVREIAQTFEVPVFFAPGNHEDLGAPQLFAGDQFDLQPIAGRWQRPFELVKVSDELELLMVPHQDYDDMSKWRVPTKQAEARIAVAHGTLAGLSFAGLDAEGGGGALNPADFARWGCDYIALGHIHARQVISDHGATFAYPGSARVWRRGESGPRGVLVADTKDLGNPHFIPLASAGEYRQISGLVEVGGEISIGSDLKGLHPNDYVEIRLSGLVEDELQLSHSTTKLSGEWGERFRKFEIRADDVLVLAGVKNQPLIQSFLAQWEQDYQAAEAEAGFDAELWYKSRLIGLRTLKDAMEGKV